MSQKKRSLYFLALLISISFLILLMFQLDDQNQLSKIAQSGELRVSTTNTEDTYFLQKNNAAGFEYELVTAFAKHLGVELKLNIRHNQRQLELDLLSRDSHISIPGRSLNTPEDNTFQQSVSYTNNQTVIVYRQTQGKKYPRNIEQIIDRSVIVASNSPQESRLYEQQKIHPQLQWDSAANLTTYEILQLILNKEIDIAVISHSDFQSVGPFFPGLKIAFELGEAQPVRWLVANKPDKSLLNAVNQYLSSATAKSEIAILEKKYYSNSNPLNFFDTIAFKNDFNNRLPSIERYFKQAAKETNIDWQLLAAIAYQESHWNPKAVSSTRVKGIMMLTKAAAKEVNVTDRTDPKQSIFGGAQYLNIVKKKIPARITDPDRTFLALAGYNTGFGHLEDARILTKRAGLNPDLWEDVRRHLPLLTKPKYYNTVKHGYARGYEPVNYVKNIRQYLTILKWQIQQQQLKNTTNSQATEMQDSAPAQETLEPNQDPAPSTL